MKFSGVFIPLSIDTSNLSILLRFRLIICGVLIYNLLYFILVISL
jgi:hypothetical protein